jgi:GGDEF domain-containing protein
VSLLVTSLQLWSVYRAETEATARRLDEIGTSIVPSLSASYWQVDLERVGLLLDGIARLPGIAHVALVAATASGCSAAIRMRTARSAGPTRCATATARRSSSARSRSSPATAPERQLGAQASSIALTTTVTLLSGALLLLLLFRAQVTRHLVAMAEYARGLNFERLHSPLALRRDGARGDELDQVVDSFNRMRETLIGEIEQRDRHEAELVAHRERLEELVGARTAELEMQKDRIQQLANTDMLTGVHSRRHFHELAERELVRTRRSGEPLAVLVLDLDHFKLINDGYGHSIGDLALKTFAAFCKGMLRQTDLLGRTGGEEFAVLMPATARPPRWRWPSSSAAASSGTRCRCPAAATSA